MVANINTHHDYDALDATSRGYCSYGLGKVPFMAGNDKQAMQRKVVSTICPTNKGRTCGVCRVTGYTMTSNYM